MFVCAVFAFLAYLKRKLTFGGALGAVGVGTFILAGTGLFGFLVLAFFFISSNILDKLSSISFWKKRANEQGLSQEQIQENFIDQVVKKGDRRDIFQVFANGSISSLSAAGFMLTDHSLWLVVMCAALAAATADTWASELGRRSQSPPIHILTRQRVEPGTSGAITPEGTWASVLGAFLTAVISVPLLFQYEHELSVSWVTACFIIFGTGWFGNWMDTYIGAKWQVLYQCPICKRKTEQELCCVKTRRSKGRGWINNDVVNTACTASAGVTAALFYLLLQYF